MKVAAVHRTAMGDGYDSPLQVDWVNRRYLRFIWFQCLAEAPLQLNDLGGVDVFACADRCEQSFARCGIEIQDRQCCPALLISA